MIHPLFGRPAYDYYDAYCSRCGGRGFKWEAPVTDEPTEAQQKHGFYRCRHSQRFRTWKRGALTAIVIGWFGCGIVGTEMADRRIGAFERARGNPWPMEHQGDTLIPFVMVMTGPFALWGEMHR